MNTMHKLWVTLYSLLLPRKNKDRGAGIIEYTAIVILVAAIAFAIYNLGLVESISGEIGSSVDRVLEGP